jgi:hypothetical protein
MTPPPNFTVLDDFLDQEAWSAVWSAFQFLDLLPVTRGAGAWKLDDGVPLGSEEVVVPAAGPVPEGDLAPVLKAVLGARASVSKEVTGEWDRLSARAYVYPAGTGLSWHVDDSERYAGAFVYYAHPHWNVHWGGDLQLAAAPADGPIMGYRFATEEYSSALLETGEGAFVAPKPNRLVLLSDAAHQVTLVRAAAGDHVRASVSGFFLRPGSDME